MSVKLRNPSGVPMSMTEELLEYLVERKHVLAKFAFGDWLTEQTDSQLKGLLALISIYFAAEGPDPRTDDLAGVAIIGSKAEKNRQLVWTHEALKTIWESLICYAPEEFHELIVKVFWAASLESHRRDKFVEIEGKIRLHPFPNDQAIITEKGLAVGLSLKNRLH
jgi:hypothetical protein